MVTQLPPLSRELTFRVRAHVLHTAKQTTPKISINGVVIGGDVCIRPWSYVATAADRTLSDLLVEALRGDCLTRQGSGREATGGDGAPRCLIVHDITCGALPSAAVQMGYTVDVVNEDAFLGQVGRMVHGLCADLATADVRVWFTGRVSTCQADGVVLRSVFVPPSNKYHVIVFPSVRTRETVCHVNSQLTAAMVCGCSAVDGGLSARRAR